MRTFLEDSRTLAHSPICPLGAGGQMGSTNYHQRLPDIDPEETDEWLESLRSVVDSAGLERARLLLHEVLSEAQDLGIEIPAASRTPYVNTIPWDNQIPYPGDLQIEKEIQNTTYANKSFGNSSKISIDQISPELAAQIVKNLYFVDV